MTTKEPMPASHGSAIDRFRSGGVIPAHPLALTDRLTIDERRQRALGRYYADAGALGLSREYWRRLAALSSTVGIKVAPFDRYRTLDVANGVDESGRSGEVALYTGNDDAIVSDLVTPIRTDSGRETRFVGGLLGQWYVWTRQAVRLQQLSARAHAGDHEALREALSMAAMLSDANSALFDAANRFHGSVPGIHEALRRVGLLERTTCLDPAETLRAGQLREIDRIWAAYPELRDDGFVATHLDRWLA
jgi:hypothetical protein